MKLTIQSTQNNILTCLVEIVSPIIYDVDFQLDLSFENQTYSFHIRQKGWDIAWLNAGRYNLTINFTEMNLKQGNYQLRVIAMDNANNSPRLQDVCTTNIVIKDAYKVLTPSIHWDLQAHDFDINTMGWKKGHEDWFYRHFVHAMRVIKDLMFNNSEKLSGKVLDVGCGDGITDLGLYLHTKPELLVGIDPFEGYKNLQKYCHENNLPVDLSQYDNLQFNNASGNKIPFDDDYFDVVLSWGSLEHIAGGHQNTLKEITRVLKKGGILFAHPGLFYGIKGNHLSEFFDDPFIHLKIPEHELHKRLMQSEPRYIDRSGQFYPPEDYWKWYKELNPITVESLEQELRTLGYEPWRVALRSTNVIEYTDEMQKYSINDLAVHEMYATFILK